MHININYVHVAYDKLDAVFVWLGNDNSLENISQNVFS